MLEASVVLIGDELLTGSVIDENGDLAARRIRDHGVTLAGFHVIPDDLGAIAAFIRVELAQSRPRLVVTSGGVGPTHDDVTFSAVGTALGREMHLVKEEVRNLENELGKLRGLGFTLDSRSHHDALSMAYVPAGSNIIRRDGWVCGVRIDIDGGIDHVSGMTIVSLPGIPTYFRQGFEQVVVPDLVASQGVGHVYVELTHGVPELVLASPLRRLAGRWPAVRIGSYPGSPMRVSIQGPPETVAAARDEIEAMLQGLDSTQ